MQVHLGFPRDPLLAPVRGKRRARCARDRIRGRPVTLALGFLTAGKGSRSTAPPSVGVAHRAQVRDFR